MTGERRVDAGSTNGVEPLQNSEPPTSGDVHDDVGEALRTWAPQMVDLAEQIGARVATVGVIGQGYVGFPLAQQIAACGYRTYGFDNDDRVLAKRTTMNLEPCYTVACDFRLLVECDVILIAVPTPTIDRAGGRREPSLNLVRSAVQTVVDHALALDDKVRLVIVESTYSPGTTRGVVAPIVGSDRVGRSVALGYSPERIDPGNIDFQLANIPKVTSGFDEPSALLTQMFYAQVLERVVPASSMEAAESTKVLENVFRFVNVTFAQEFDQYCEHLGVSAREVTNLASTKPFGFMPFFAGAGIGGHCIAEDPYFLLEAAWGSDVVMPILEAAIANHEARAEVIVDRVSLLLGGALEGSRIIVLGVAYKPDIEDARRTPAADIVSLLELRGATVDYHDPYVPHFGGRTSVEAEAIDPAAYDLAVLLTKHRRFETGPVADADWRIYDTSDWMPATPRSQERSS